MRTIFLLGTNRALSVAEASACLLRLEIPVNASQVTDDAFIVEHRTPMSADILRLLGGTIKIARVIAEAPVITHDDELLELLTREVPHAERKLHIGFSCYGGTKNDLRTLEKTAMGLKRKLQDEDKSVRIVTSTAPVLSSVIVAKEHLLDRGAEFVFLKLTSGWIVGRTASVQDFAEYGARDVGRPSRDQRSGTMPPKVCQMMINLSLVREGETILDPFCGSGTILQEALQMGLVALGSDKSPSAIKESTRNMSWFAQRAAQRHEVIPECIIKQGAIAELTRTWGKRHVDAIVTEPYLGKPLRAAATVGEINDFINELVPLYATALSMFHLLLKPRGRVVMVWPVWVGEHEYKRGLPLEDAVHQAGFTIIHPLDEQLQKQYREYLSDRGFLLYGRAGQKVWREIVVMEKGNQGYAR